MAKPQRTDVRALKGGDPLTSDPEEIRKKREMQRNLKFDAKHIEMAFKRIYADRQAAHKERI